MANTLVAGTVVINTEGAISASEMRITGIQIAPTTSTWVVKLSDTAGNTIISLNQDSPSPVIDGKTISGLTAVTLTSITEVILWIN